MKRRHESVVKWWGNERNINEVGMKWKNELVYRDRNGWHGPCWMWFKDNLFKSVFVFLFKIIKGVSADTWAIKIHGVIKVYGFTQLINCSNVTLYKSLVDCR